MHSEAAIAAGSTAEADAQLGAAQELLAGLRDEAERRTWLRDWQLAVGYLLEGQSRLPEALRYFEQAGRLTPEDGQVLLAEGTVSEILSLLPDLIPRDREAAPVGSPMLPELVERNVRERYQARALELYEKALQGDGTLWEARLRRGRILELRGEGKEAGSDLEAVAQGAKEPYLRSLAFLFLGQLAEREGRSEQAVERYRAALAARPGFQTASVALARALDRLERGQGAERVIEQGLSASSAEAEDPWIGYHLGLAWRRQAALDALKRRLGS